MNSQGNPILHDLPIGIHATGYRHETDSIGGIDVPAERYWGGQTPRNLVHFSIGNDRMPNRVYHAYGYVEEAAALVNEAAVQLARSRVMVRIQVISEDNAVVFAGSQGNFEIKAISPIIIKNFLHSARVLGDACGEFRRISVERTRLNRQRIDEMLGRSLVLVTALSPVIGYDKASAIAHKTIDENLTLKEAALRSGVIDEKRRFNEIVDPTKMVGRGPAGSRRPIIAE